MEISNNIRNIYPIRDNAYGRKIKQMRADILLLSKEYRISVENVLWDVKTFNAKQYDIQTSLIREKDENGS